MEKDQISIADGAPVVEEPKRKAKQKLKLKKRPQANGEDRRKRVRTFMSQEDKDFATAIALSKSMCDSQKTVSLTSTECSSKSFESLPDHCQSSIDNSSTPTQCILLAESSVQIPVAHEKAAKDKDDDMKPNVTRRRRLAESKSLSDSDEDEDFRPPMGANTNADASDTDDSGEDSDGSCESLVLEKPIELPKKKKAEKSIIKQSAPSTRSPIKKASIRQDVKSKPQEVIAGNSKKPANDGSTVRIHNETLKEVPTTPKPTPHPKNVPKPATITKIQKAVPRESSARDSNGITENSDNFKASKPNLKRRSYLGGVNIQQKQVPPMRIGLSKRRGFRPLHPNSDH